MLTYVFLDVVAYLRPFSLQILPNFLVQFLPVIPHNRFATHLLHLLALYIYPYIFLPVF